MTARDRVVAPDPRADGALPEFVVIGAMKCGTSALHRYLDRHPEIAMSDPKELNYFIDPPAGRWHLTTAWYVRRFDAAAVARGESSPGYTSPSYPRVAARMARVIPDARIIYLVRDPIERALSQYRHHRRDDTETRSPQEALLDPASQYIARGRYYERLAPFLERFPRERIAIVACEELLNARRATLRSLFGFVGVDDSFWSDDFDRLWHRADGPEPELGAGVRMRLAAAVRDDVARLRALAGRDLTGWSV
jgi:hypothetical protein